MKFITALVLSLIVFSTQASVVEVYVSVNGNDDTGDGTLANPYRTIQKGSNILSTGGTCYIMEGTYRETITVKYPNQTFTNYNNEQVIVTGLDILPPTQWTLYKDGIYQNSFSGFETQFTEVFAEGAYMHMARYPSKTNGDMMDVHSKEGGYGYCIAHNAIADEPTRKVEFPDMPSFPANHWEGGYFKGITGYTWMNPHGIIAASSGTQLSVTPKFKQWIQNEKQVPGHGWGYIFHLNALDIEGEWYWKDDKIYFKPPSQDISKMIIEAKKRQWAFKTSKNNTTIKGLHIKSASIEIKANNCLVENTTIRYLFPYFYRKSYSHTFKEQGGLYINGNDNTYKGCYVAHSWGNGFSIESGSGNTIENCFIDHIGWNAQFTSSILTHARNTTITRCTMGATGRFHIRFQNKTDITYSDFYDCMKMGQDAGSIEATSGGAYATVLDIDGSEIAYNHIHDSNTLPKHREVEDDKQFVVALYIEDVANYTAHHNLIWNFKTKPRHDGAFVYLGPRRTEIYDVHYYNNTVWNCDWRIRIWNRDKMGNIRDTKFYNNLMDSRMIDDDGNGVDTDLIPKIEFKNNIDFSTADDHFVDKESDKFFLTSTSSAIDAGIEIAGITDGYKGAAPDIGAFEHGVTPWSAGSEVTIPEFIQKEDEDFGTIMSTDEEETDPVELSIETSLVSGVNIYPNPVTGNILHVQSDYVKIDKIEILGLNGNVIFSQSTQGTSLVIPLNNYLSKGMYLMRISTKDFTQTSKLILSHP
ncbi:T9SS type A sorting domain-containing protein [Reichenbachiella versicolor]|uniref:T9SS type A sorting domain-containing protein n=1 Tax=Reichenbachiella versicolor TaxID=1821036 RepID=UPI000D6E63FB|nr:T9SS type A sorting domain-containing protein [Reichenbachiella versicolor]